MAPFKPRSAEFLAVVDTAHGAQFPVVRPFRNHHHLVIGQGLREKAELDGSRFCSFKVLVWMAIYHPLEVLCRVDVAIDVDIRKEHPKRGDLLPVPRLLDLFQISLYLILSRLPRKETVPTPGRIAVAGLSSYSVPSRTM